MIRPKRHLIEAHWLSIPLRSPEQVDAVDENRRLVLAYVRPGERLPNTVRFGNVKGGVKPGQCGGAK
jgi:hypothetical protein